MSDIMKDFAHRLLAITDGCRPDMHEPDEQDIKVRIIGNHLDNALGDHISERAVVDGFQEYVVIVNRFHNGQHKVERFNLATLIAMARKGAATLDTL